MARKAEIDEIESGNSGLNDGISLPIEAIIKRREGKSFFLNFKLTSCDCSTFCISSGVKVIALANCA